MDKVVKNEACVGRKGRTYLRALYALAGIGRKTKDRLKFMEGRFGGNVQVSHANTPAEKLSTLEICEVTEITS